MERLGQQHSQSHTLVHGGKISIKARKFCKVPPDEINNSGIKTKKAAHTERKDLFEVERAG